MALFEARSNMLPRMTATRERMIAGANDGVEFSASLIGLCFKSWFFLEFNHTTQTKGLFGEMLQAVE